MTTETIHLDEVTDYDYRLGIKKEELFLTIKNIFNSRPILVVFTDGYFESCKGNRVPFSIFITKDIFPLFT